ncbi:MAG: hypothetical protein KDJ97_25410 [Anaerolineae bacterium]|nr:hypothetical protein [Anaerolineae bacterium]
MNNSLIVMLFRTLVKILGIHRFTGSNCPHHHTKDMGEGWVWCTDCGEYWQARPAAPAGRSILVHAGKRTLVMVV